MKLKLDEQETIISMTGNDRTKWIIVSDDPVMINKLNKITKGIKINNSEAYKYELPNNQITIRKQRKQLSEQQKNIRAERLKLARQNKNT